MDFRSLINKVGQKIQLSADIYPLPSCDFYYKWEVIKGKDVATVDSKGVLTVNPMAIPGDTFTVKTTAVTKDPFIKPKASIIKYLLV